MHVVPDRRLLIAAAAWTGAAGLVVLVPALWPALLGALLLLGSLVLYDIAELRRTPAVEIVRAVPERVFVGCPAGIELQLRNPAATATEVELFEELAPDLGAGSPSFGPIALGPLETRTLRYTIHPTRRGDRPFGRAAAFARSPLGLLRRCSTVEQRQEVRVYPDTSRFLRPDMLDPRRVFALLGTRPARRRGEGMDFESLRDYVPGDDPRRLDWAATARRGRPVTRLYQHERNHTVVLALDTGRLMAGRSGERSKLDYAVDAALALAYAALVHGDRVAVVSFDRDVSAFVGTRSHRRALGVFIDVLRTVQPRLVETDYRALARRLAVDQRQRALLIVLTDFVETAPELLIQPLALLARRHQVLLVAVRDAVYEQLEAPPADGPEIALYRRVVLDDLLQERERALGRLRRCGLQTLDLPPERITAAALDRYLAIRHGPER